MTLSLRARLLLGLVLLVGVGLLASDVPTYELLENSLIGRVDRQLRYGAPAAANYIGETTHRPHGPGVGGSGPPTSLQPDTFIQHRSPDGTVQDTHVVGWRDTDLSSAPQPVLPSALPTQPKSVSGMRGISQYRLIYESLNVPDGDLVVLGIPLDDVNQTLQLLLFLEAPVSFAVLLGMAVLARWIIRIGLRPLEQMGATAQAIAGGDLSRRVEPATPRTEIGRLGLALNSMLTQIESAFAEQTQSEQRLRRFVADASHELRTPLTSIRGYAELLRRGASEKPHDAALARRRIEEEAVRMSSLVDDMLLLARLDQGRPLERAPVDLTTIARDARSDAAAVAPNRTITLELEANCKVVVTGDEMRLRQVVGNLVRNALVHTPSGSPIEIGVGQQNGSAILTVADHGPGLPSGDTARVFEAFYRADPSRSRDRGGSGLGLSIVAAVVAAHRGKVQALPTDGGGATFRVELPLASAN